MLDRAMDYMNAHSPGRRVAIFLQALNRLAASFFMCLPAAVLATNNGSGTATIEGHIRLPAAPPPAVMAQRYEIISRGGVLSTIPPIGVVWLEGEFPEQDLPPPTQIVQRDFTFDPALIAVRVGTTIEFPNEDDEYHNVFSYSPTARFDLGRYLPEERPVPSQTFNTPGMVTLRCDIHEHMRAIILILDSPNFVTTDTAGYFRLENVPSGNYTLKAWIDSRTTLERNVQVKPGETLDIAFE